MIARNQVFSHQVDAETRKLYRVVLIDATARDAFVVDLGPRRARPRRIKLHVIEDLIAKARWVPFLSEPFEWLLKPEFEIDEAHKKIRDRRYELIRPLLDLGDQAFDARLRCRIIKDIAGRASRNVIEPPSVSVEDGIQASANSKAAPSASIDHLYELWSRWLRYGGVKNALLPRYDRCGSPDKSRAVNVVGSAGRLRAASMKKAGAPRKHTPGVGRNMTSEDITKIQSGAKEFLYIDKKHTWDAAFRDTLAKYYSRGIEIRDGAEVPVLLDVDQRPSLGQFRYWARKSLDIKARLTRLMGPRSFSLNHRAKNSKSAIHAWGPGAFYQIDATIADIILVHRTTRQPIGRPTLYLVVDVWSHAIVATYVTLGAPSYFEASQAIYYAASDKVRLCREYGITISTSDWPCHHLCDNLVADRGELDSNKANALVTGLNLRLDNVPPYRADLKGLVESKFQSLNTGTIHWLPAATNGIRQRHAPNPQWDAMLDISEFTALCLRWALLSNKTELRHYPLPADAIAAGISPIPNKLWEWGLQNRGQPRTISPSLLMVNLLPCDEDATMTDFGLKWRELTYTCDHPEFENWKVQARSSGSFAVKVAHEPRNIGTLWLRPAYGVKAIHPCKLIDFCRQFDGWSLQDYERWQEQQKEASGVHEESLLHDKVASDAFTRKIKADAFKKTEEARGTRADRKRNGGNLDENRAEEKRRLGQEATGASLPKAGDAPTDGYIPPGEDTGLWGDDAKLA